MDYAVDFIGLPMISQTGTISPVYRLITVVLSAGGQKMQERELVGRLERLEQSGRQWRRVALLLGLACLVVVFAAFDFAQPFVMKARTVEAQSFVLRDSDGQIRARMAMGDDGPRLTFYDEQGKIVSSVPLKAEVRPAH